MNNRYIGGRDIDASLGLIISTLSAVMVWYREMTFNVMGLRPASRRSIFEVESLCLVPR